jgi:hypothetical protein
VAEQPTCWQGLSNNAKARALAGVRAPTSGPAPQALANVLLNSLDQKETEERRAAERRRDYAHEEEEEDDEDDDGVDGEQGMTESDGKSGGGGGADGAGPEEVARLRVEFSKLMRERFLEAPPAPSRGLRRRPLPARQRRGGRRAPPHCGMRAPQGHDAEFFDYTVCDDDALLDDLEQERPPPLQGSSPACIPERTASRCERAERAGRAQIGRDAEDAYFSDGGQAERGGGESVGVEARALRAQRMQARFAAASRAPDGVPQCDDLDY